MVVNNHMQNLLEFVCAPTWRTTRGEKERQLWILNHTTGKAIWANEKFLTTDALYSLGIPYTMTKVTFDQYMEIRFEEVHPRTESSYTFAKERPDGMKEMKVMELNKQLLYERNPLPVMYEERITEFIY